MIKKYGIMFNKMLKENYPQKHDELKKNGKLNNVIHENENMIIDYDEDEERLGKQKTFDYIAKRVSIVGKEK